MTESLIPNNIKIRAVRRADAEQVGQMIQGMAEYLRSLGDNTDFQFNANSFLHDGFGQHRAFYGLLAEVGGKAAGYALYYDGYDTDKGYRIIFLADLYVRPEYRGIGLGRQLIETVKTAAKKRGAKKCSGRSMPLTMLPGNFTGTLARAMSAICWK